MAIVYYKIDHIPDVYSSEEWCLESNIIMKKHELGLPIWVDVKILKDYAPITDPDPTDSTSSSNEHTPEPKLVPKRTRSRKTKQETSKLCDLSDLLAEPREHNDFNEAANNLI